MYGESLYIFTTLKADRNIDHVKKIMMKNRNVSIITLDLTMYDENIRIILVDILGK